MQRGKVKQVTDRSGNFSPRHPARPGSREWRAGEERIDEGSHEILPPLLRKQQGQDDSYDHTLKVSEPFHKSKYATQHYAFQNQELLENTIAENLFTQNPDSLAAKLSGARHIGTFLKKFLFFENGSALLIVDQHAAQERIVFERLKRQLDNGTIEAQQLLTPILLKLTPQELLNWEETKEQFEKIGLSTTLWDKETIALHTTPQLLKDPEAAARGLLSGEDIEHCDNDTLARRACRCSIMAGDPMDVSQVEYQRRELLQCHDPFTCPHGRPTIIEMTEGFLNKQFLRT